MIGVLPGQNAAAHGRFDAQEHLEILEVLNGGLDLELLGVVRYHKDRLDLPGDLTLAENLRLEYVVKVSFERLAGPVFWINTLDMKGSGFETLLVFVLAHLLIIVFEGHFGIPTSLLNVSDSQHGKNKNDCDARPSLLGTQLFIQIRQLFAKKLELVVRIDDIQEHLSREADEHHMHGQLLKPSLKKQVHVPVNPGVRCPVVLIQILEKWIKHLFKD